MVSRMIVCALFSFVCFLIKLGVYSGEYSVFKWAKKENLSGSVWFGGCVVERAWGLSDGVQAPAGDGGRADVPVSV
jgi:hypothetical protein